MGEGGEQPRGDAFIYALRDEAAYLETGEDEKPAVVAEPLPHRASFKCSFCTSTDRRVLFGSEYPVRDPETFAVIAQILICDRCIARFAGALAREDHTD